MRNGSALRYAKMDPARDHPPRSPRFALRCGPGIRTSWCPAQRLNAQWACHAGRYAKMEAAKGHPPRSLRCALQPRPGVQTSGGLHTIHMRDGSALRYAKMEPARDHPPLSPRFALRRRPSVRTSWRAAQQPHLRGGLALHCGPDVGCGHPGALHRIHIRNAFAKMGPAEYHPRRSPRFALRHRSGVRTSGCPA